MVIEQTYSPRWLGLLAKYSSLLHLCCICWLVATLILPFSYQRPALVCFFVSYGLEYLLNQRWKGFEWRSVKWAFVAMILFFLLQPFYHFFESTEVSYYHQALGHRASFVAFGVLGILGLSPVVKIKPIGVVMLLTSALSVLYLLFVKIGMPQAVLSADRTYLFMINRVETFCSHMNYNIYLNTSLLFGLFLLLHGKRWERVLTAVASLVIFYALMTTEGRVGFATGAFLVCVISFELLRQTRFRKWAIPMLLLLVVLGGAFGVYHVEKVNREFKGQDVIENPRIYIWDVTFDVLRKRPLLGYGVSDGRNVFVAKGLDDEGFVKYYVEPNIYLNEDWNHDVFVMHPHNMVLNTWVEFGIVGVLLLLSIFLIPMVFTNKPNRYYVWLFVSIYVLQGMFEVIGSNLSPLFFGLFILLFIDCKMVEKSK